MVGLLLLLLVFVAGIPLWLFSGLITVVYAFIVPLAAVAQTLLFGDAVAQQRGIDAEPPNAAMSQTPVSGDLAHR